MLPNVHSEGCTVDHDVLSCWLELDACDISLMWMHLLSLSTEFQNEKSIEYIPTLTNVNRNQWSAEGAARNTSPPK